MIRLKKFNLCFSRHFFISQILLLFFISLCQLALCQNGLEDSSVINEEEFFLVEINGSYKEVILEEEPKYLNGGNKGFLQQVYSTISYPSEAREKGIDGVCLLRYEITEEGRVENIVIVQDPGGGIGEACKTAFQIATEGKSYSPGIYQGRLVRVRDEMPIQFGLQ